MPTLNLHGHAKEAQGWFETHSHRFESYLSLSPDASVEKQRELALDALRDAVRVDEVATDLAIISWGLSEERIASFKEGVIAGASDANFVERVFRRAEAFLELDGDAADAPRERGFHILGRKAFLSQVPDDAHVHYEPLPGDHYGRQHSHDAMHLLCEALDEAPTSTATLDTAEALLKAVDAAMEEMHLTGQVIILLAGRWNHVRVELRTRMPEGVERGSHLDGEVGRYRDNPILTHYPGERRLYIVEPSTWGQFVRARFEDGQELRVQVDPISEERAQELLDANPDYIPEESERASKLRKLQTRVELRVAARVGFRVTDASRARRIIHAT